ncbi:MULTISPECIES: glycoside hydrolase family 15 protein [Pandoraea]|uniref:glycoside hydrolase family 15 protein n=1 Tax=Pandoraea TaxID=93217 RepID=UPI001F5CFA80|nr:MULTISPECIES: glycoside hydrolase family 15 protein [Pandoraea]MCI3206015.1 glucoamylase [Pandoraea sp. LA3]MDN4584043.1 glucoamylase [Pandoraea capi]
MPARIEDYAMIGDCRSAALVARDGSIDWLCWPYFDSPACFAALLGGPEHGRWKIAPDDSRATCTRRYHDDTLILETRFETVEGCVAVIDFMPLRDGAADLVRLVKGVHGTVSMSMELILRFDYGASVPWSRPLDSDDPTGPGMRLIAGPDKVVMRTPVEIQDVPGSLRARFDVKAGETVPFVLSRVPSHHADPREIDPLAALTDTERYWRTWANRCQLDGRWSSAIRRSLIVLKALTFVPTGGVVAAPTTSLPEQLGGERNWDYRYCWLRDATLTLQALMLGGYYTEASDWSRWLVRAVAGAPSQVQIMYGLSGERRLPEWEVDWLPGYEGSKPVRVGNGAVGQLQLDVYGEVMDALHQSRLGGLPPDDATWEVQTKLVAHLETVWREPDEGIWEVRGGRQHFTYSKVMAWVAFDRAIKSAERFDLPGPVDHWRQLCKEIHADVCANGFDKSRNAFMQAYGSSEMDASVLMIPLVGFLPPDDPRVIGTVEAVERDLMKDGLVQRYRTSRVDDGLPAGEGAFLACSFWMVDCLVMIGRHADARALFERLLSLRNDVGLLAEEYDTTHERQVGNFPQAFSHIALVHAAIRLEALADDDRADDAADNPDTEDEGRFEHLEHVGYRAIRA